MTNGTIKWFDTQRGYRFKQIKDGGKDAFVHVSALAQVGLSTLREGQTYSYDMTTGTNGETAATNLQAIDM